MRYAPQFQLRSGAESHRQKPRNESNPSPYFKNRRYLSCDRVRFGWAFGSPTIAVPRKHPRPFHFVHCQPHEHLSLAFPFPPLSHSAQAVQCLPSSSVKLCITRHSTGPCAMSVSRFIVRPFPAQGRLILRYAPRFNSLYLVSVSPSIQTVQCTSIVGAPPRSPPMKSGRQVNGST